MVLKGKVMSMDLSNKTFDFFYIDIAFITFNVMASIEISYENKHKKKLISLQKSQQRVDIEVNDKNELVSIYE